MSINCIRTVLESAAQSHSNKTAVVFAENKLSYAELFTKVNQVAFYLDELSLPKGGHILKQEC